MHKKLAADLNSLAHDILKMRDKEDIIALKQKAQVIHEKLTMLAYIEEYINTTPQAKETKDELLEKFETAEKTRLQEKDIAPVKVEESIEQIVEVPSKKVELTIEEPIIEEVAEVEVEDSVVPEEAVIDEPKIQVKEQEKVEEFKVEEPVVVEEQIEEVKPKTHTLEDELKGTLPVDVMADLFTKVEQKKSINDRFQGIIKIGLNDRIAFVNHLFDGNQQDFNRVISQLNTIETEKEAKNFIQKVIKLEHDWTDKEEYETRFIEIIERKFM